MAFLILLQINQLLELWRAIVGSNATVDSFIEHIKDKTGTRLIIEKLKETFEIPKGKTIAWEILS